MVKARGAGRRRGATQALPGVQADVVVVAAGGQERGGITEARGHLEAEHVAVKTQGAFQVGHLEVNVAEAGLGMDGVHADG